MKAHDVHAKIHKPAHEMSLVILWQQTLAELKGLFVGPFTNKQRGQLKQFAKLCPPGKAELVLEHTLHHWLVFITAAETHAGAYKTPASPEVGFLLQYAGIAINLWHKHVTKPKFVPTVQLIAGPKVDAPDSDDEEEEPVPTKAEAMAYFFPPKGS
jgi:hypothetical protein